MSVPTTTAQQAISGSGSGSATSAFTGVIGGAADASIIGAVVIFLLWKRWKSGLNEPGNIRYDYIPKD